MSGEGITAGSAQLRAAFVRGAVITLAGAGLWGVSGSCAQFVLAQGANPLFVSAVRALISGMLFLALIVWRRRSVLLRLVADRRARWQVAVFGLGLFGSQFTYVMSIDYTNAGTATVLQMLGSVFIMLFVCVKGRALPRAGEAAGLACALGATYLIATQGNPGVLELPLAGLLWGVVNGVAVALYVISPREFGLFSRYGSVVPTGLGMCVAGLLASVMWLAQVALSAGTRSAGELSAAAQGLPSSMGLSLVPTLDVVGWLVLVVGVGVVGTFVAFGLYLNGVARVGSVAGGLLGAVEPLSATVVSALWLGTTFSWADWAGFALMVAMVALVTVPGRRARAGREG